MLDFPLFLLKLNLHTLEFGSHEPDTPITVPLSGAEPTNSVPISKTSKLEDTIASHSWLRPITASLHPKD